jgi:MOSC domain-containing protein YiiM
LPQGELPLDPGILKATSEANERRAGIYAAVVKTGRIRIGDEVRLLRPVSRSAA